MKSRNIIAILFILAGITAQPAYGWSFDWVSNPLPFFYRMPVRAIIVSARWAWQHVAPVTKAGLQEFEQKQKDEISRQADKDIDKENLRKTRVNQQIGVQRRAQDTLKKQADHIIETSNTIQGNATTLQGKLSKIKNEHTEQMPVIEKEIEKLQKQFTQTTVLMRELRSKLSDSGQQCNAIDKQLSQLRNKMNGVTSSLGTIKSLRLAESKKITQKVNALSGLASKWQKKIDTLQLKRDVQLVVADGPRVSAWHSTGLNDLCVSDRT